MSSIVRVMVVAAAASLLVSLPLPAQAPSLNLNGTWDIQATAFLPDIGTPCEFQGTGQLMQDGLTWSGQATLMLVSGPDGCPSEMMANITGNLDGNILTGVLDGGKTFGMASFTGSPGGALRTSPGKSTAGAGSVAKTAPSSLERRTGAATTPSSLAGSFNTTSGPFSGIGGTWIAARQSVLEIPTLTGAGLALLVVLLLGAATFLLLGRRRTA